MPELSDQSPVKEFSRLLETREQLRAQLPVVPDIVRPDFEIAEKRATGRLLALAEGGEVRDWLQKQLAASEAGRLAMDAYRALDALEVTGLFASEELQVRRADLAAKIPLGWFSEFVSLPAMESAKAAPESPVKVSTPDVEPVELRQSSAPDKKEKSSDELTISLIDSHHVMLGDQLVPLSGGGNSRYSLKSHQFDYAIPRLRSLCYMVGLGRKVPVSSGQLFQAAFGQDTPFNNNHFRQLIVWLDNYVTVKGKPAIAHNGKRGPASSYELRAPLKLAGKSLDEILQESTESKTVVASKATDEESIVETKPPNPEQSLPHPTFTYRECQILLGFIDCYQNVLTAAGATMPPDDLIAKIDSRVETENGGIDVQQLNQARRTVIEKISRLLVDESFLSETLDSLAGDEVRSEFFEYVFDLAQSHQDLLRQIAEGFLYTRFEVDAGRRRGWIITGVTTGVMITGKGKPIKLSADNVGADEEKPSNAGASVAELAAAVVVEIPREEPAIVVEETVAKVLSEALQDSTRERIRSKMEQEIDDVTVRVVDAIVKGNMINGATLAQAQRAMGFSKQWINMALQLGVISKEGRRDAHRSLTDIVALGVYRHKPAWFRVRPLKRYKTQAIDSITQLLEEQIERRSQAASPPDRTV